MTEKFYLVPTSSIDRTVPPEQVNQQYRMETKTPLPFFDSTISPVGKLRSELEELNKRSSVLSDYELWHAYAKLFSAYLLQMPTGDMSYSKPNKNTFTEQIERSATYENIVLENLPSRYRQKAKLLLTLLKTAPNTAIDNFGWNDNGQVKIQGQLITGTNLYDLIYFAIKNKIPTTTVRSVPRGWENMLEIFQKINLPESLSKVIFYKPSRTLPTEQQRTVEVSVIPSPIKSPVLTRSRKKKQELQYQQQQKREQQLSQRHELREAKLAEKRGSSLTWQVPF
jgi:hypothetical protein